MDTTHLELPDWLAVYEEPDADLPQFPRTKEGRELRELVFTSLFERVLEEVQEGKPLSRVVREDPRGVNLGQFMAWINRNPDRARQFEDAKEIGTYILEEKLDEIAEGVDVMEDIERSKLRYNALRWRMQAWNRKRYGEKQQIEQTNITIDLTDAMKRAEELSHNRGRVIEHG